MKVVNQCRSCGAELSAMGVCETCATPTGDTSIRIALEERPPKRTVQQISTLCGIVLVLLTLGVGGAYVFHEEITNVIRGVRVPDPETTRAEARTKVNEALKRLEKPAALR